MACPGASFADADVARPDTSGQSERVADAIRATVADTREAMTDMAADEAMTRRALDLLGSRRNDAYEAALVALREDTGPGFRFALPGYGLDRLSR